MKFDAFVEDVFSLPKHKMRGELLGLLGVRRRRRLYIRLLIISYK